MIEEIIQYIYMKKCTNKSICYIQGMGNMNWEYII